MVLGLLAACQRDDPGPAPVRRLTGTAYNNTVRDLLGFALDDEWPALANRTTSTTWPWDFPEEPTQFGFEGMAEVQTTSPILIEAYADAAVHYSSYVDVAPAFWTCERSERDEACALDSIARFANRAFRRPLDEDEASRVRAGARDFIDDAGLEVGVRLSVVSILMAPQVLYRLEVADAGRKDVVALTDWELASRLSYLLWESMPDATLFEAAASGQLQDPEALAQQARRMLQDPRAEAMVLRFHEQWLDLDALYSSRPDMYTFGESYLPGLISESSSSSLIFTEDEWSGAMVGTRKAMRAEAALFLTETAAEDGTLAALLTASRGYASIVNSDGTRPFTTASLYGAETPSGTPLHTDAFYDGKMHFTLETYAADLPAGQRAGVLTLGAVLMGRAHPVHPAPIQRGVFVLERLACETLGAPPENAAASLPADDAELDGTNRARTEGFTAAAECAGCHEQINPPGFAFEHYDTMSAWRAEDNGEAVDASGELVLSGGETIPFDGALSLAEGLAESRQVHDCYAQHWLRYAFGREVDDTEVGVSALKESFYTGGGDIEDLLVAIVMSDLFRTRRAGDP